MIKTGIFLVTLLLIGCSQEQPATVDDTGAEAKTAGDGYEATVRWTSYGIPHIKANDWGSLGYGAGYSLARDAICVLAEEVVTVNGNRARYFGPGDNEDNIDSDVFHRALLSNAAIERLQNNMNARMEAITDGYVAGYNRYLNDRQGELPAACNGQDWVRPIERIDVAKITIGVGIRYGWGRITSEIANATPPAVEEKAALAPLPRLTPDPGKIGSNAYAIGKSLTQSGKGLLLGNPHYPWKGPSRFHLAHFTVPGELDVMGAGLYTTGTWVAIGFNRDIAWSHTVSTALRFTLFELSLVEGNPLAYQFGDKQREMEKRTVTVHVAGEGDKMNTVEKTVYMSHFGPVFESADTPWTPETAYVMRDVNFENDRGAPQYFDLGRATSVADIEASLERHQGASFVNTIATDRFGNAFYGDLSAIPYVDEELLERCKMGPDRLRGQRVVVLDGSTPDCQWKSEESAAAPGILPPDELPRLTTDTYVTNSNDSYWLSNPDQRLEGYSPIIGDEGTARSLRTRAGIRFIQEVIESNQKFKRETVQNIMYNHRNYGAELLLDDILKACDNSDNEATREACDILAGWDRKQDLDSEGAQLYTELWKEIHQKENLYAVPYDASDPVNTPRGINISNPEVKQAVLDGLATASDRLTRAEVPLDAPWGEVQFVSRNGEKIGIPGGLGQAGMFSNIYAPLREGEGFTPVVAGNSYIQVVTWDEENNPDVAGILTYSQSQQPGSPHYADQTKLYSRGKWVEFPFTEEEIQGDLQETMTLRSAGR